MQINQNTKISDLIKANKDVIEALASINKHFEKLRNPVLRKILASRVTIADAAKIGGSDVDTFFAKLKPLGFECTTGNGKPTDKKESETKLFNKEAEIIYELDVRPILAGGEDPFNKIISTLDKLAPGTTLKIINTFEPIPLIKILTKKGYEYFSESDGDGIIFSYFKKVMPVPETHNVITEKNNTNEKEFEKLLNVYKDALIKIDVRNLEMPQPLVKILAQLDTLPEKHLLFVQHKKVPQFLFPELLERNCKWAIKEVDEGNVQLLIYKQ